MRYFISTNILYKVHLKSTVDITCLKGFFKYLNGSYNHISFTKMVNIFEKNKFINLLKLYFCVYYNCIS